MGESMMSDVVTFARAQWPWPSSCAGASGCEVWNGKANCNLAGNFTMPPGDTIIPSYAFAGCTDLTSITGLENVTSIGQGAFYNSGLTGEFAWPVG